ncbi:DNA-binding protein [Pseudomonas monteilii SB3078]|uniref:Rha family transcriptional regulator n=1 Tax=Pseudomonas putida group TaxID=136845 RepID=UPI0003D68324|nr:MULTISPECIES: Rha family transcriptional regulator [Pseudomonas putida group]AHC81937.1 DNA-binding protein [Pseudomonas monteilii SB3078]MDH4430373.1 Rha family transcriptional regulator [Pseudomonas shirazica]
MNLITPNALTMSSQEIADLVGSRHDNVRTTIQRLAARGVIQLPAMQEVPNHLGQGVATYLFTGEKGKRDSLVVVAQLSPEFTGAIVDRWQELERQAGRPMTQAELIAASANQLVAIERRQAAHQVALERVEDRTTKLEQVRYLDSVPSGFETITTIRDRINRRHGLPAWVVNAVMREVSCAPLPYAFVRSRHADEGGQPFAIWPKPAVTQRFDRFVTECTYETAERATHPEIPQGRFKIRARQTP